MCLGCSKEPSHLDGSFEYPQHMFQMRNKENSFPIHTLIWSPGYTLKFPKKYHIFYSDSFTILGPGTHCFSHQ